MAPNCEPRFVTSLIACLSPRCHGYSLAGAGGGGFLCLVAKEDEDVEAIQEELDRSGVSGVGVV